MFFVYRALLLPKETLEGELPFRQSSLLQVGLGTTIPSTRSFTLGSLRRVLPGEAHHSALESLLAEHVTQRAKIQQIQKQAVK